METIRKKGVYITPSEIIEYLYCPRFIYFMNCLSIPQHEEQRYKVLTGREIHEKKAKINKDYLRRKLNCNKREINVYLASAKYHLKGVIDEVLFLEDGTAAPLDYKFAEFKERLFHTHKVQSTLYAILIKDNYQVGVDRGYICYTRSKNLIKAIDFKEGNFIKALEMIDKVLKIIQTGYYPKGTKYLSKCADCCYKNICV
jgi:CRISPR-associated exonuclease Cas4